MCLTISLRAFPGLAIGDTPGSQPIGIVFTVVGVVVLDFCADASEGPIRAYLLDVADTEEQDLALTIHAFSAGNDHDASHQTCINTNISLKKMPQWYSVLPPPFCCSRNKLEYLILHTWHLYEFCCMMCMSPSSYFFLLGLGGAVGYMLGGLDWTGTLLGSVFKSQEQVLFIFTALIFSVSVVLHLFSIPEQPQDPAQAATATGDEDSASQLSLRPNGYALPYIDIIAEEDDSPPDHDKDDAEQDNNMDFFSVERVRSKSDSVLVMPEATIKLDPDLHLDSHNFLPEANPFPSLLGELDGGFAPSDEGCPSICSPLMPCSTVPPTDVIVELQPLHHSLNQPSDNHPDSLNKKVQYTFIIIIEAFPSFGRALFHNYVLVDRIIVYSILIIP